MKFNCAAMYLEYVNNFLTVGAFADHYQISNDKAIRILNIGRKLNQEG